MLVMVLSGCVVLVIDVCPALVPLETQLFLPSAIILSSCLPHSTPSSLDLFAPLPRIYARPDQEGVEDG
jgi:hypothetical protein